MPNRLAAEVSPYLLQHAHNPVDWYPWGEEALERARREDRPLLLSVGYSACHWCHVMERESFEDPATAALMNELFVNVKVDREERPDVDQIYMRAVQALIGSGGWPLTVFLTPEGEPYYGGTYFPPVQRHGMPAFSEVLRAVAAAYHERPGEVREAAARLVGAVRAAAGAPTRGEGSAGGNGVGAEALDAAVATLARGYDPRHGGFGGAPKFPQPTALELLLRHHARTGAPHSLEMAVHTLERMAAGGMRDHLGGGFHRYAVDARWLVPHFEKMLYDNALLARVYVDAHRLTGDAGLRAVAEETLDYVLADLRSPEGAFFSARDADSEGEEGRYYVWTPAELTATLDADADLFGLVYGVTPGGNFEGRSILHLPDALPVAAARAGLDGDELAQRLQAARRKLLEVRAARVPPALDDKVLAGWNGLTVRALAEAGAALGRADYTEAAEGAGSFLWASLRVEGRLRRVWAGGAARVGAFLEDHAALGNAFLSLYEATLDPGWLEPVTWLAEEVLARFHDPATGLLYDAASDAERLVVRPRDATDGATPSGTSLAVELLLRAGHLLGLDGWSEAARRALAAHAGAMQRFPQAFGRLLSAVDRAAAAPVEVAVVGRRDEPATWALHRAALAGYRPNLTLAGREPGTEDGASDALPVLEGRTGRVGDAPVAYVCRGYACRAPTRDPAAVAAALDGGGDG